jgi:hypothetical protein
VGAAEAAAATATALQAAEGSAAAAQADAVVLAARAEELGAKLKMAVKKGKGLQVRHHRRITMWLMRRAHCCVRLRTPPSLHTQPHVKRRLENHRDSGSVLIELRGYLSVFEHTERRRWFAPALQ